MKRKLYYRIYYAFVILNMYTIFGYLIHYIETFVYFVKFSKWIRDVKPPILDNKKVEKDITKRRFLLHQKIVQNEALDGEIIYLEFGVASGTSLKWWVNFNNHPSSEFYGFDTFEGLPEAWFSNKKGDFDQSGKFPDIKDSRLGFVKGLYQDTLFNFLDTHKINKRKVVHIDADLYSSTLFVLTTLHRFLKKGDIIIFDDFGYLMGEFRALEHYSHSFYAKYEVIGSVNTYAQVAIKII